MSKIELDNITSGYNLGKINANFVKIENALTNNVLFRDATGSTAGPNQMVQNIDMDSQSILNLPTPTEPTNPVRLQDLGDYATSTELTEVDNRLTAADTVLQNNINTESGLRISADAILTGDVNSLDGRVTTLEQGTSGTDLYIHWLYNNGLALGGEVQLNIPYEFTSIATVYINGVRMSYGLAFDFDVAAKTVQLAEPLVTGDEVVVSLGVEPQEVSALVQSITEEVVLTDGQTVVTFVEQNTNGAAYYINGPSVDSRFLSSEDFTASSTTNTTITLTESYPAGSIITLSKNVAGSGGIDGDIRREFVHNEPTLAVAVTSTLLRENDAINLRERTTGNGGGAMWDVVLSTSVTENGYNIVQCTGVPTLSLVLRIEGAVNVRQFGAKGDGVVDDTPAIQAAINYLSDGVVFAPVGNYSITGLITKSNISIKGEGLNATYFYVTGSGAVGIRCAAHDSLLGADDAAWGTFEDFGIRFSNGSQVGISFVGLSRWYTKNVLTIMAGFGATGIQCKSTVTRASGGPSQWYNRFENVNNVGTAPSQAAGAIGWDIGGTLATDEQATAWYVTGGRTNFCQIGVWLKGVSHVDFTNHVTETNDDNYIIGTSGVGERHANDVNIVAAYIEAGGNGISLLENSFRCSIIKPDMTSGTGTAFSDLGDENKLQDFASINKMTALTYEITKLNPLQNPVIIGSSAGYDFNDSLSDTVTTIRNGRSIANSTSRYQIVHEGVVELRGGTVSHGIYPTKTIYGESLGAGAVGAYVGSLNPPTNGIGKDGDTYTSTGGGGTFYQKRSGAWVSI